MNNKIIEEIAKADKDLMQLCKLLFENWDGTVLTVAKTVLEHYQPKLLEDSVIISQKEYDALKTIERYHIKSCGKDSVVLTREDYEELEQNLDKLRQSERANILAEIADGGTSCHWCMEEHGKIGYEKGSKETAEKILQIIELIDKKYQNYAKEELQSDVIAKAFTAVATEIKIEIAKQFGVEIKE